jgi:acyl-CoA hydrolase/GNAT superfamily N-acetyltransferase
MPKPNWRERYGKKIVEPERAFRVIKPGFRIAIGSACGAPQALISQLVNNARRISDVEIVHLITFGDAPYAKPEYNGIFRHNAFFIGANVRQAVHEGRADYTPIMLSDIPALFKQKRLPLDLALIQVSPPDDHGYCSLGVSVDLTKAAAENADIVIAQVNDQMPRVLGDSFIHADQIDYIVAHSEPVLNYEYEEPTETADKIGYHISKLIENGSTIQTGIGTIPNSMFRYIGDKKDLGVHSEVFTDGIIDLIEQGVVTCREKTIHKNKIVASFAMGSKRLYDYIDNNPFFEFHPTDYVNNLMIIAQNNKMTSINAALTVDLTGQVNSDSLGYRFYSGIGGQADFTRGAAMCPEGKAIITLPSTTRDGNTSRIVLNLDPGAGVTITRGDVHYIVTEWGIAYLHGKTIRERVLAMIQIAHPKFRAELMNEAKKHHYLFEDQMLQLRPYPIEFETSFEAKNGEKIFVRPVLPVDENQMREMFYDTSDQSRQFRYFAPVRSLPHQKAQPMVNIDYDEHMEIVGLVGGPSKGTIIATAGYFLDRATNSAEVAFTTRDDYHNQGVGSFMLKFMMRIARTKGIHKFSAQVLPQNHAMIHVFHKVAEKVESHLEEGVYSLTFETH